MKLNLILGAAILIGANVYAASAGKDNAIEQINNLTGDKNSKAGPVRLKDTDRISTKASFKPPVEITIVAKTDSTDLRLAYAADQVIFNWRDNITKLRIDGGPANGKHTAGVGQIPTKRFVTIKWIVLPTRQEIYVDGDLRFIHEGDYSKIDKPIAVFCMHSNVTVKSIKVRDLTEEDMPVAAKK